MIFDFLRRKQEPFPEKGEYRGITYRIDGDEVVVRCSSGQEIAFGPPFEIEPEEHDRRRTHAQPALHPWMHRDRIPERKSSNTDQSDSGSLIHTDDINEDAKAYGISVFEYAGLARIAEQIMQRYWRSRKITQ